MHPEVAAARADLKQTSGQLLQLLFQLDPDLRQTFTLLVLQLQLLRTYWGKTHHLLSSEPSSELLALCYTCACVSVRVCVSVCMCVCACVRAYHLGGIQLFPEDLQTLLSDFLLHDLQGGPTGERSLMARARHLSAAR